MKIKILIAFFLLVANFASAQLQRQSLGGSPNTESFVRGVITGDSSVKIASFPDTIAISPKLKLEDGLIIKVGVKTYMRDVPTSQWVLLNFSGLIDTTKVGAGLRVIPKLISGSQYDTLLNTSLDSVYIVGSFLYAHYPYPNEHLDSFPISGGSGSSQWRDTTGGAIYYPSLGNVGVGTFLPPNLLSVRKDQNTATSISVTNAENNTAAQADFRALNSASDIFSVGIYSLSTNPYGAIFARSAFNYTSSPTGIAIMSELSSIRFAAGGNVEGFRLDQNNSVSIGSGADAPASAITAITSTTKGVLLPRMTTADKNAISSPATSLLVFDTDLNTFNYWDGAAWVSISGGIVDQYVTADSLYHVFVYSDGHLDSVQWVGGGGSLSLQDVTDVGNTSTNNIQTVGANFTANDGGFFSINTDGSNATLTTGTDLAYLSLQKSSGTTGYLMTNNITGSDKFIQLPNANATLVASVNGSTAGADGNVIIYWGSLAFPVGTAITNLTGLVLDRLVWTAAPSNYGFGVTNIYHCEVSGNFSVTAPGIIEFRVELPFSGVPNVLPVGSGTIIQSSSSLILPAYVTIDDPDYVTVTAYPTTTGTHRFVVSFDYY